MISSSAISPPPPYSEQTPYQKSAWGEQSLDTPESPLRSPGSETGLRTARSPDALRLKVIDQTVQVRLAFVRKVYLILLAQLTITFAMSLLFFCQTDIRRWVQTNSWVMVSFISILS